MLLTSQPGIEIQTTVDVENGRKCEEKFNPSRCGGIRIRETPPRFPIFLDGRTNLALALTQNHQALKWERSGKAARGT